MRLQQPSDHLFQLLDFCDIRQVDVATALGVSKTLVSLWRSGHRDVPAKHHAALIQFAVEKIREEVRAHQEARKQGLVSPEEEEQWHQRLKTFGDLEDAAKAERDPQVWYKRFVADVTALNSFLQWYASTEEWDEQLVLSIEAYGNRIAAAARLLHAHLALLKERKHMSEPETNGHAVTL